MAKLTTIEGIGPTLAEKMKAEGVGSIEALRERGATKKGRQQLAEATGIDVKRILRFVKQADLMRINGVGAEYAELLEAVGVDSIPALARRNPANLRVKMAEINEDKSLVRSVASTDQVVDWVEQAKDLPKAVTH